ncbi:MAG: glucose 1-dehydrogenase [Chloroflexi bacterium]|nr:MAG: glucose 1-dehydrogenase [Chloroflexota bacterium]TMG43462.1 MAG: glucose 1-dehydrogenase [Chloroflexota bacterium]
MNGLRGKVAIVTGGGRGLGYAIVERLVTEGVSVAILALHAESVRDAINNLGADRKDVIGLVADVTLEEEVRDAVARTVAAFGHLDIMVNNAGTIVISPLVDMTTEAWDHVVDVNLRGVFLGCREAARQMIAQGRGGRIINGASGAGRRGGSLISAYSATKFGVIGLTQSLAVELAPHGITVNAYCPGHVTSTPMWDFIDREMASITGEEIGSARRAAESEAPLGRAGKPEEVAAAVAFLASDEAPFITGESLLIDGGLVRF